MSKLLRCNRDGERVVQPMFSSYLFVQESPAVDPVAIRYVIGVSDLIRQGGAGQGTFLRMKDYRVVEMQLAQSAGQFDEQSVDEPVVLPPVVGDRVTFKAWSDGGLGTGWMAKLIKLKRNDRAVVLLRMISDETRRDPVEREIVTERANLIKVA